MEILGISHDCFVCSACVVVDGKVVAAISEERLDRVKQSSRFPILAVKECLKIAGLEMDDVDEIAIAWNPGIDMETVPSGYLNSRRWRVEHFMQVPGQLMRLRGAPTTNVLQQTGLWENSPPITYVDHYSAHIGNALMLSPYETAAFLVMDGRAERLTGMLGVASGVDIKSLKETNFPHSLGLLYGAVTQFLGYRPDSDEWKVMAMGSHQPAENEFTDAVRSFIEVDETGGFTLDLSWFEFSNFWDKRMWSDRFTKAFGKHRVKDDPITERDERLAAATQLVFEETISAILTRLHEQTGEDRLVVSGGCFMNSVCNGKLEQISPFKETFVSSCPDDSGTSVGAALYLHGLRTGKRSTAHMVHNYWGREFSDEECLAEATRYKLPGAEVVEDPAERAARDLVDGKLIGWFQSRAEFGQRALGNRSIIADPRSREVQDKVNAAVKYREKYRPFAPAILAERVADYFVCEPGARVPFMERVLQFREEKRAEVPAVVHADGSGRLQTVDEHSSPRYHALIREFAKLTGTPVVLNTSFNLNGEPMVDSPRDAIRTFYSCGLDVLYLGNVRIAK